MIPTRNVPSCTAAIWLLVSGSAALASPSHLIQLQCDASMQHPLCTALSDGLRGRFAEATVEITDNSAAPADLTVSYVEQNRAQDWISGALAWRHSDGRTGTGPIIEHTVMDGQLNAQTLAEYAAQLVQHTEFPL